MLRSKKQGFVEALEETYKQSNSLIITHYHGLTVSQMTALRKTLKENGAGFKVVKNTLTKIAAEKVGFNSILNLLSGPTAIAYSEDAIAAAKGVVEFAKNNEKLKIIGALVNNQLLNEQEVQQLAKLPSLDELRGKIIGILQAPATKLVGTLQAPAAQVARLFQAYVDKN